MKDKRLLLLALVPGLLGAAAALLLSTGWLPDPQHRLVVSGDWAGLLLGAGVFLSAVLGLALLCRWRGGVWGWQQGAVARLERARERQQLYGRLDHELKNPLTAIWAGLGNIQRERLSPEEQRSLDNALGQVRHLAGLVQSLRKVAAVATQPLDEADVDMGEVVEGTAAALQERHAALAGAGGRRLVLHVGRPAWNPPTVRGDRDLLAQALQNVVENACKFSPPDSPVEVWCMPEGDWLRLKVVDQGVGIPPKDLPHLGTDLFRGDTARSVPGYGLGLAMVQAVLDRHGGDLQVESEVGQGTAVTLSLPLAGRLPAEEKRP